MASAADTIMIESGLLGAYKIIQITQSLND